MSCCLKQPDRPTASPATPGARSRSAPGMTVVELLVSVSILVVMILSFSTVLSQSGKVVSTTQRVLRANAAAASIAQVIRPDLRRATKRGFMCIMNEDQLYITVAGPTPSLMGGPSGSGSLIGYGLCASSAGNSVLVRSGWVLNRSRDSDDSLPSDLVDVQKLSVQEIGTTIQTLQASMPTSITTPPTTLEQIQCLWQYLTEGVSNLSIAWTDGTLDSTSGALNWYGANSSKRPVNYQLIESGGGATYRALWTPANPSIWPVAVKITFIIENPDLPEDFKDKRIPYEIICNVGQ